MATRDPGAVDATLVSLVAELSRRSGRPAEEPEVRAALSALSSAEEAALRRLARRPPAAEPLGPMAWVDVARGTPPETAAAREVSGYYALLAERDALASMLQARAPASAAAPAAASEAEAAQRGFAPNQAAPREPAFARVEENDAATHAAPAAATAEVAAAQEQRPSKRRAFVVDEAPPADAADAVRASLRRRKPSAQHGRAEEILGLFAYHRDAPLVARALRLSMAELEAEIDALQLRRRTARLVRGLDTDMPAAAALPGASGPPVRRRTRAAAESAAREIAAHSAAKLASAAAPRAEQLARTGTPPPPPRQERAGQAARAAKAERPAARAERKELPGPGEKRDRRAKEAPPPEDLGAQAARLKALLGEVGPRREALAARLGAPGKPLPVPVMLARFRAAGLERELGQRERDLIRALLSRHRSALGPVARELQLQPAALRGLIEERGLAREVEAQREAMRRKVRERNEPRDRVEQVLRQREWLLDLGIFEELEREVTTLARAAWDKARGQGLRGPRAFDVLRRELRIPPNDARAVAEALKLR